jgi:hypothetical protein
MNHPQTINSTLSEILGALRRIWRTLKERIVPSYPAPAPVPVRSGRRR